MASDNFRTTVLACWQPQADLRDESDENQGRVRDGFVAFIKTLGYEIEIQSINPPSVLREHLQKDDKALSWHRDCDKESVQFIIWSNVQPTDVLFLNGMMLPTRNGAVILVDNLEVQHRTPQPVNPNRWLIRSGYLRQ